ncbi:MAG TPA: hypothetical protein VKK79_20595 [Candidatus Lokiarchaeia archaeon]|nr:hypothetical protein [Candidatus Lokiarchaeia archaeon]
MSALNSFSLQLSSDNLGSFTLGRSKYVISREKDLMFVARTDPKTKDLLVKIDLQEIKKIFFENVASESLSNIIEMEEPVLKTLNEKYDRFLLGADEKMRVALW